MRGDTLYIQYSCDIDFDYSTGNFPKGIEPDFKWEEYYIPIEHEYNREIIGPHVWRREKVGSLGIWSLPQRIPSINSEYVTEDELTIILENLRIGNTIYRQSSYPNSPNLNDIIFKTNTNTLEIFNGTSWILIFDFDIDLSEYVTNDDLQNELLNYVPYTGASGNVDLGHNSLTAEEVTVTDTANANVLATNSTGQIIQASLTENKLWVGNSSNLPVEKDFYKLQYFDATVGTGGDYSTVQLALADSKYNLKIISNITETVDWGSHPSKVITLIGDTTMRTINLSVSNTSVLTIFVDKIKFSITGTNRIFAGGCYLTFKTLTLQGDSSINNFICNLSGDTLHIYTGTNSFQCYIYNVNELIITGQTTANALIFILGVVGNLQTAGTFGSNSAEGGLRVNGATINKGTIEGTGNPIAPANYSYFTNVQLNGYYYENSSTYNKCTIKSARCDRDGSTVYSGCYITTFSTPVESFASRIYSLNNNSITNSVIFGELFTALGIYGNLYGANVTINSTGLTLNNEKVAGNVVINGTNNILENCRITGNLTINSDYCKIINCVIIGVTTLSAGSEYNVLTGCTFTGGLTDNSGVTNNEFNNNI